MLKQSPNRMKKVLIILLVVLFVVSLTAVTASAARHHGHHGWGHHGHHGLDHHWRHHCGMAITTLTVTGCGAPTTNNGYGVVNGNNNKTAQIKKCN